MTPSALLDIVANRLRAAIKDGEVIPGPPWALNAKRAKLSRFVSLSVYVGANRATGRVNDGPAISGVNLTDLAYRLAEVLRRDDPALFARLHGRS